MHDHLGKKMIVKKLFYSIFHLCLGMVLICIDKNICAIMKMKFLDIF